MTREEQIKYFNERYGIKNIFKVISEKVKTVLSYEDLKYQNLNTDIIEINVEPFSINPHNAIGISGKKPYNQ